MNPHKIQILKVIAISFMSGLFLVKSVKYSGKQSKHILVIANCGDDEEAIGIRSDLLYHFEKIEPKLVKKGFSIEFSEKDDAKGCGLIVEVHGKTEHLRGGRTDVEMFEEIEGIEWGVQRPDGGH